ncbi:hypothetical protein FYZ42_06600 [Mobiluncus mulieris]|nr:hypothetical protein [Mobiluncus mulieris]MCV0011984.1 hypothetical protein [Mobiluncus mulieris]MCV0013800.1 hypothetical protein [Mobiluncus mulieris]
MTFTRSSADVIPPAGFPQYSQAGDSAQPTRVRLAPNEPGEPGEPTDPGESGESGEPADPGEEK